MSSRSSGNYSPEPDYASFASLRSERSHAREDADTEGDLEANIKVRFCSLLAAERPQE